MKLVLALLAGLLISSPTFAKDELISLDGKNIKITDTSGSNDPKINTSTMQNGVFVRTGSNNQQNYTISLSLIF